MQNFKIFLSFLFISVLLLVPIHGFGTDGDARGSIIGYAKDEEGRIITNINLSVFAYRSGEYVEGYFEEQSGKFSIPNLKIGDWFISADTDPRSGFTASLFNMPITVSSALPVSADITLGRISGIISGRVSGPDGMSIDKALVNVVSTADNKPFLVSGDSDLKGLVRFLVPAGKYLVQAFFSPKSGVINPETYELDIQRGALANLNLIFRKPDRQVSGLVRFMKSGTLAPALVWTWSEKGGYTETHAGADGRYELNLKADARWHIKAANSFGLIPYESLELVLEVGSENIKKDLDLIESDTFLPDKKAQRFSGTNGGTFSLDNGMRLTFPANLFPGKELILSIVPYIGPSQKSLSPIGSAYNIKLFDSQGAEIIQLPKSVILELPYSTAELTKARAKEDNLRITHWDKNSSAWRANGKSVVDTKNRIVIGLTRLLAAGVVTTSEPEPPPPSTPVSVSSGGGSGGTSSGPPQSAATAPSVLTATALDSQRILINWFYSSITQNQTSEIERSSDPSSGFQKIASQLTGQSFTDTGLVPNTTYYYRIIGVNPFGRSGPSQVVSAKTLPPPPDTTAPTINNTVSFKTIDKARITVTTTEPATSKLSVSGVADLQVINFVSVTEYEIPVVAAQTYTYLVTATDSAGNIATRTETFTAPGQLTLPPPTQPIQPVTLITATILGFGDRNSQVTLLQRALIKDGQLNLAVPTEFYGFATRAAVIALQNKYLVSTGKISRPTGVTGPLTIGIANSILRR